MPSDESCLRHLPGGERCTKPRINSSLYCAEHNRHMQQQQVHYQQQQQQQIQQPRQQEQIQYPQQQVQPHQEKEQS